LKVGINLDIRQTSTTVRKYRTCVGNPHLRRKSALA